MLIVLTVTFDQLHPRKTENVMYKQNLTDPKFLNGNVKTKLYLTLQTLNMKMEPQNDGKKDAYRILIDQMYRLRHTQMYACTLPCQC